MERETMDAWQLKRRLYDAAFRFRKARPWDRFLEYEVLGVKFQDGGTGYICVAGKRSDTPGILVFPDQEGLDSLRLIDTIPEVDRMVVEQELSHSHDCISCLFVTMQELSPEERKELKRYCQEEGITLRGKNACPRFIRQTPHHAPWTVNEREQERLREGLLAALKAMEDQLSPYVNPLCDFDIPCLVFDENGEQGEDWIYVKPPRSGKRVYEAGALTEEEAAEVRKKKRNGTEWLIDLFYHTQTFEGPEGEPDYYPMLLLVMDSSTGLGILTEIAEADQPYADFFSRCMGSLMLKFGRPEAFVVPDQRVRTFIEKIAEASGITVRLEKEVPMLDRMEADICMGFGGTESEQAALQEEMLEMIIAACREPFLLSMLPDEVLCQFKQLNDTGVGFPMDVVGAVRREMKKRGLK